MEQIKLLTVAVIVDILESLRIDFMFCPILRIRRMYKSLSSNILYTIKETS